MPSAPLAPDQRALLSSVGVAELPQPIPAGLLTLPIFRSATRPATPDERGILPESAWRVELVMAEPANRFTVYEITGDPRLGLPFGKDSDVLLAIAALADQVDADGRPLVHPDTGEFAAPSLRAIARVLGLEMGKDRAERFKAALDRLARVRITTTRVRQLHDIARPVEPVALPAGNALPVWVSDAPLGGEGAARGARAGRGRGRVPAAVADALPGDGWVKEAQGTAHLIDYEVRTEYHRRADGEDWIARLQINPQLLEFGVRGWVGWIDCPVHARLDRPVAKRLYQLVANAQARQAPLRFELASLRQLCGLAVRKPAELRADLMAAAEELRAHDVLAGAEAVSVSHGRYVFHFEAGPRLQVAGWLRGVGTLDLAEHRVLRLLLASLDVAPRAAERLVTESAGQVRHMLAYVLFRRDTQRPVANPGKYLADGVAAGWRYDGQPEFQQWLRTRTAEALRPAERRAPAPPSAAEVGEAPATARRRTGAAPAGDPSPVPQAPLALDLEVARRAAEMDPFPVALEALPADEAGWWEAAVADARPFLHALAGFYLSRARPALRTDATLLVVAHNDLEATGLRRELSVLSGAIAAASGGAVCEVLVLSPQQWTARARDVPA